MTNRTSSLGARESVNRIAVITRENGNSLRGCNSVFSSSHGDSSLEVGDWSEESFSIPVQQFDRAALHSVVKPHRFCADSSLPEVEGAIRQLNEIFSETKML